MKVFRIKAQDKASPGSSRSCRRISCRKGDAPTECFPRQPSGKIQRDEIVAQVERRALN